MKPDDDAAEMTPQDKRLLAKALCRDAARWYREANDSERGAVVMTIVANVEAGAKLGIPSTGVMGSLAMAMFAQLDALDSEKRAATAASAAQGE